MRKKSKQQKKNGRNESTRQKNTSMAQARVVMVQIPGRDVIDIGVVAGKYASTQPIGFTIPHADIVGALESEDKQELGSWALKTGFMVLSRLIKVSPAMSPEEMVNNFIKFAKIDMAQVKKEADLMEALQRPSITETQEESAIDADFEEHDDCAACGTLIEAKPDPDTLDEVGGEG